MQIPKWLLYGMVGVALVGFADAAYLTAEHLRGVIPPCTIAGCEIVLSSRYATIGSIPLAGLGALYYATIALLYIAYLDTHRRIILQMIVGLVSLGLLASGVLVYLQLAVLRAICQYCMLSALTTALLFSGSIYMYTRYHE